MIQPAQDYNKIVQLFDNYIKHKKSRVLTHAGFWRFLLLEHSMPAWIVKQLKRQVKLDPNLAFHLDTVIEDHILTGALTGVLKESSCKLVLKNKFGYEESPTIVDAEIAQKVKTVTYRAATQADVKALEAPDAGR